MSEPNNNNSSSSYVLKLRINGEYRRVSLPKSPPPTLRSLERLLREIEPSLSLSHTHSALRVVWTDEEGDEIRVGSDYELREAIHAQTNSGSANSGNARTATLRFSVSAEKVLSAPAWNTANTASSAAAAAVYNNNNNSSSADTAPPVPAPSSAARTLPPTAPTAPTGSTGPWGYRSARSVPQKVSLFEDIIHSVCGEKPVSLSALRGERDRERQRAAEGLPFSSFAVGNASARAAEKRCAWAAQRAAFKERERERERERLQAKREREREKTSKFVRAMDEHAAQVCASLSSFPPLSAFYEKRERQQAAAEPQPTPLTQQPPSHTEVEEKQAEQEKREEKREEREEEEREEERGWAAIVEVETVETENERDSPVLSNDNTANTNNEQDKAQEKEKAESPENDEENEHYTELGSEDWNVVSCSLPAYVQDVYSCAGSELSEDMFEFDQEKEAAKEGENNDNNNKKSVPAVIMGSLNVNVHSIDSSNSASPVPASESVPGPVPDPEVPSLSAKEGEKDGDESQALHAFARLWRKELEVLAEMGFDDRNLAAVAPLLREFIGSPSALKGARAQIDQLGMDRLIAALLDL